MSRRLRVHHLLCTTLFQGEGYSEGFCYGMEQVVGQLREDSGQMISPVCVPDEICGACPHLTCDNTCNSNCNQVVEKDKELAEMLQIHMEEEYSYDGLQKKIKDQLTEKDFQKICKDCRWYKAGLCSYECLLKNIC